LLIERGRNNYKEPSVVNPALFPKNLDPANKTAIFYKGKRSEALAGREPIIQSGGVLGGGSSINFMMYA
jgi:alcohol oxidase